MSTGESALTSIAFHPRELRNMLEEVYARFNGPKHIHPDPLEFVYCYATKHDMEVAGFIASALAYGRVGQILVSVRAVLDRMGPSPSSFLLNNSVPEIMATFRDFKHRFTTGEVLAAMLAGVRELLMRFGSLENCFLSGFNSADKNIIPALSVFVKNLNDAAGRSMPMFLPSPSGGSACKRLNLFLRWMVRRDNVDPGVWRGVSPSRLVVPLDIHMHRIARAMGFTSGKQANMRCALEVTDNFASICPEDPVRYDFALTRLGMNGGAPLNGVINQS